MTTDNILTKTAFPLGRLFALWLGSGLGIVVLSLIYVKLAAVPTEFLHHNEIIRLIQGAVLSATGLWAITTLGVGAGSFKNRFNSGIGASLKLAVKYFLIYALAAIAVIGALSLAAMLLMKLGVFSMDSFNGYHARATAEKLTHKNYLREVLFSSPPKLLLYLFATCVLIPIEEEIFTRRLLYVSLRRRIGFYSALIISSLVFGLEHLGGAMIPAMVFGGYLTWIYDKHQDLAANMMVHGMINFSVIVTMLFFSV